MSNKPSRKHIWLSGLLLLIVAAGFLIVRWATFSRPPLSEAIAALEDDDLVMVTTSPWLTFSPLQTTLDTGFVFYPGGRIDPRGYAPLLKTIASAGYLVVLPEMPINMAVFRPNLADEIMAAYPAIGQWVIGGHSVGGTMAAQYTHTHREAIAGLVIWASYPANNANLADADLPVVLIYGSRDPRVDDDSVAKRQHLLPSDTWYVRIDGGDHHQFGSYSIQPQEHHATIDRVSQQDQIIEQTLYLLEQSKSW